MEVNNSTKENLNIIEFPFFFLKLDFGVNYYTNVFHSKYINDILASRIKNSSFKDDGIFRLQSVY